MTLGRYLKNLTKKKGCSIDEEHQAAGVGKGFQRRAWEVLGTEPRGPVPALSSEMTVGGLHEEPTLAEKRMLRSAFDGVAPNRHHS